MGKPAERISIVCPMCLSEFPERIENEPTPHHFPPEGRKPCEGSGRPLEAVVTVASQILIYRN